MRGSRHLVASVVSLSLLASSTAALASAASPPPPSENAWLALSMLTPSGAEVVGNAPALAICGAAAAAVQPGSGCVLPQNDVAPTPQPPAPPQPQVVGSSMPPIPVLLIWAAVIGLDAYLLLKHHHHRLPNSPA